MVPKKLKTAITYISVSNNTSINQSINPITYKMSSNSRIERLVERVESLKLVNKCERQRILAMIKEQCDMRKSNDGEIASLNAKLSNIIHERDFRIMNLNDIINTRDSEISELKEELQKSKTTLSQTGLFWAATTDVANKHSTENSELKEELEKSKGAVEAMRIHYNLVKGWTDDEIAERNKKIASLMQQLDDQREFTESAIAKASETEGNLFIKNANLQSHVNMLTEELQQHVQTIRDMEEQITEAKQADDELVTIKAQLAYANKKLTCIADASTYITDILSK